LAQTDPIETLTVSIEGDFSGLLKDADEGVDKTKDKLGELDGAAKKGGASMGKGAAMAGAAFGLAATAAAGLLTAIVNIATSAVDMFKNLSSQAVQMAGDFEQVQLTFTNIFKDRGQANAFLKGLQTEATKLGVSFGEASQFAKSLFPDTSSVEQFNELLRVAAVGAADAGLPLQELIFSFNEAVSGDFVSIRDRLDIPKDVIERVKAAPDIVSGLTTELDKLFTKRGVNDLEAAGSTLQGLQRRIKGFSEELLLVAGLEILGPLREGFQSFFDILEQNKPALDELAGGIGEVIGLVVDFAREEIFTGLKFELPLEGIKSFIEGTKNAVRGILAVADQIKGAIEAIAGWISMVMKAGETVSPLLERLDALRKWLGLGEINFKRLDKAMVAAAQVIAIVQATIKGLTASFAPLFDVIGNAKDALVAFLTGDFEGAGKAAKRALDGMKSGFIDNQAGAQAFKESMLASAESISRITDPAEEATETVEKLGKAVSDAADTVEAKPLLDPAQLEKFGDQLAEATENRAKQQAELEQETAEKIQKIVEDANEKRLQIDEKFSDDMEALAQDSEQKRVNVIQKTREALADLEESTDQQLSSRRKDFNKNELRQTEDHLKAMRPTKMNCAKLKIT
jgi:flagellar biosynthesis GTPase FlhF